MVSENILHEVPVTVMEPKIILENITEVIPIHKNVPITTETPVTTQKCWDELVKDVVVSVPQDPCAATNSCGVTVASAVIAQAPIASTIVQQAPVLA